ncbi:MAG: molybdopterin-binding protein [Hyphomicrobiales bacterium]|nr:molybdopterin-binding protein [Hyphomicrobiales bacterium]
MKFGTIPVADSAGAILAHAVRRPGLTLKKGDVIGPQEMRLLQEFGVAEIVGAQLDSDDVGEDAAAAQLAQAIAGEGLRIEAPFTGRSNLFAVRSGLLKVDAAAIDRVNGLDESVTIATLPQHRAVVEGEMIGTVKIIPFAVPGALLRRAIVAAGGAIVSVKPYRAMSVAVVSTLLPGLKPQTVEKTARVLQERLAPAHARIVDHARVEHDAAALAPAIAAAARMADLVVVFGASAITDRRDVIPAALERAGGRVEHFGMPVDPGNLLLIGQSADGKPVVGAPGCARSPRENGFDFILSRLLAGERPTSAEIRAMGVGGLLMEIVSRPQPREGGESRDDHGAHASAAQTKDGDV